MSQWNILNYYYYCFDWLLKQNNNHRVNNTMMDWIYVGDVTMWVYFWTETVIKYVYIPIII